jgi:hypothetical protein
MENNVEKRKKWRISFFDIFIVACALVVALLVISYSNRSTGSVSLVPTGTLETVVYTLELQGMRDGSAYLVQPGDSLIDRVERRALGTVVTVEIKPSMRLETNMLTGDRVIVEVPERMDAIIVVRAQALVTDSQISVDGFAVRVGARVSVNGPTYNGSGFIAYIERGETS